MKAWRRMFAAGGLLLAGWSGASAAEESFDRLEELLTFSGQRAQWRARLSGTVDAEIYAFPRPVPGLIDSASGTLFSPRLSVFLDAQFGPATYLFAQARVDRGFDPTDRGGEIRLDEVALRIRPWGGGVTVQAGKFATIVGNWAVRHGSWSNPFITAPAAYEVPTGIWDTDAIRSPNTLLQWSHLRPGLSAATLAAEKSLRVPIIWGPAYSSGVAVAGGFGPWRYAVEAKAGSLSSRPDAWLHAREQRHHPTGAARLGYHPNPTWNVGLSASAGSYLREWAPGIPAGYSRGDYEQRVLAVDFAFARRHWQIWAEGFASRFTIPRVGDADVFSYYVEAKYKFGPRLSWAWRWNQQSHGDILDRSGAPVRWGRDLWRVDVAPCWRFTPHTQFKVQYSYQRGDYDRGPEQHIGAAQFTVRF